MTRSWPHEAFDPRPARPARPWHRYEIPSRGPILDLAERDGFGNRSFGMALRSRTSSRLPFIRRVGATSPAFLPVGKLDQSPSGLDLEIGHLIPPRTATLPSRTAESPSGPHLYRHGSGFEASSASASLPAGAGGTEPLARGTNFQPGARLVVRKTIGE